MRAVALVVVAMAALGACASTADVEVAPNAADPVCASVVLALPQELADLPRLETSSQGTAAWGDASAPVALRCGVEPLPPTTDPCVTVTDPSGVRVDWVAVEDPSQTSASGGTLWTFTTYGREPAVEVVVPPEVTAGRSASFLVDLGPAVAETEQVRECL